MRRAGVLGRGRCGGGARPPRWSGRGRVAGSGRRAVEGERPAAPSANRPGPPPRRERLRAAFRGRLRTLAPAPGPWGLVARPPLVGPALTRVRTIGDASLARPRLRPRAPARDLDLEPKAGRRRGAPERPLQSQDSHFLLGFAHRFTLVRAHCSPPRRRGAGGVSHQGTDLGLTTDRLGSPV